MKGRLGVKGQIVLKWLCGILINGLVNQVTEWNLMDLQFG